MPISSGGNPGLGDGPYGNGLVVGVPGILGTVGGGDGSPPGPSGVGVVPGTGVGIGLGDPSFLGF